MPLVSVPHLRRNFFTPSLIHYGKKVKNGAGPLGCLIELRCHVSFVKWMIGGQGEREEGRLFGYIIVVRHKSCPSETIGNLSSNSGKEEFQYLYSYSYTIV